MRIACSGWQEAPLHLPYQIFAYDKTFFGYAAIRKQVWTLAGRPSE